MPISPTKILIFADTGKNLKEIVCFYLREFNIPDSTKKSNHMLQLDSIFVGP
jgi:hypothetical protein